MLRIPQIMERTHRLSVALAIAVAALALPSPAEDFQAK